MRRLAAIIVGSLILQAPSTACAGLYHPDVLGEFDIREDGTAEPLPPDTFFLLLNTVKDADWNTERLMVEFSRTVLEIFQLSNRTQDRASPGRYLELLRAIEVRKEKGIRNLSPEEKFALSGDLLRLRFNPSAVDEALGLLSGLSRRPPEGFEFPFLAHYSYTFALRGEWPSAFDQADSAIADYALPQKLLKLSKEQLDWYRNFERQFHVPLLRHRRDESRVRKRPGETPGLDPLFRPQGKKDGVVRFVGESGEFEVGTIAASEKAKLPSDALAIVQQLVLWYPSDDRLMWQLAELYNALGDVKTSAKLFEMCVRDLKPKSHELRDHRSLVLPAAEKLAEQEAFARAEMLRLLAVKEKADAERKAQEEMEKKRRNVLLGLIFGLAAVFLLYWQAREIFRRYRGGKTRGPASVE